MTRELIEMTKDRDYFYRKAKQKGDEDSWRIAKHLRNITNLRIRQAKREFVLSELERNENNAKKFWKTIREIIPDKDCATRQEILLKDGGTEIEKKDVAGFINNFFINVGNVDKSVTILQSEVTNSITSNLLGDITDVTENTFSEVSQTDVWKTVREINISKSSGLDNVSSYVIKEAFSNLIPEVTFMLNLSIRRSSFPNVWKKALVIPIPKQGNLTKVQNLRPISLLPLPGKILEKLVHRQLSFYLEGESLLVDEQHGFRRNHSTIHAVAQVTNYVNRKLDSGLPTIAVFIDFKKAFDCVQHSMLLSKLAKLNLCEGVIAWVKSYLTNRKQRVLANETYSNFLEVTQGVPQGSVLGPLFYTDDTVLYISHPNFKQALDMVQQDMNSLSQWCMLNGIAMNIEKNKTMVFGSSTVLGKLPPTEIRLGSAVITEVTSYKYLGMTLDPCLNYNLHVSKIIGSVTNKLRQFRRMRSFLNTRAALLVYKGTILPILEYGDIFLSAATAENRRRLQILQNRGLRCAPRKGIETSTTELHSEANLLRLKFRREQHLLNFMFDSAQNLKNHKTKLTSGVKTRSANKVLLKIKKPRTEKFKKSMTYVGVKKWNSLPESFHHTHSKMAYKALIAERVKERARLFAKTYSKTKLNGLEDSVSF